MGGYRQAVHLRSGGFDTGAAAVRLPAIGRPSQVDRISPMEPPRGVPVSNRLRLRDFLGFCGPLFCLSRQPTGARGQPDRASAGVRLACRVGGASGPSGPP
jgi:hypothetical protein